MKIINDFISHLIYQAINIIGFLVGCWMVLDIDNFVHAFLYGGLMMVISFIAFCHRQNFY